MSLIIPRHIAIVMDGNGRWAESQGLPRIEGHRAGAKAVKSTVECCVKHGVKILSVFAFSRENWSRPTAEVQCLMQLFLQSLQTEIDPLHKNGVRLCFTGDRAKLSSDLQVLMKESERLTQDNQTLILNVVVNYSGKWDIVQAAKAFALDVAQQKKQVDDLNDDVYSSYLATYGLPEPDLLIRTSGEQRISNFFLWQLAYTELYFTQTHWPDFSEEAFEKALESFSERERRYGLTSSQLNGKDYV